MLQCPLGQENKDWQAAQGQRKTLGCSLGGSTAQRAQTRALVCGTRSCAWRGGVSWGEQSSAKPLCAFPSSFFRWFGGKPLTFELR